MAQPLEVPAHWLAAFPGTRFLQDSHLMIWRPEGVLNEIQLEAVLRWTEAVELSLGAYNRFIDFSGLTEIHLRFTDVQSVADRRRERYAGEKVTSVFLAETPLTYAFARMYGFLMEGLPIDVRVVSSWKEASELLAVSSRVLRTGRSLREYA